MNKRFKIKSYSAAITLMILGIIILINILSFRHFIRIDLTEGKKYTISKGTKQILKELDDLITIKVYTSKDMPTQLIPEFQKIKDTLFEYEAYGHGNLILRYLKPDTKPEIENEALQLGVPKVNINILETGKKQAQEIFFGIAITFEDKNEIIPLIKINNLEYDLSSSIKKLTTDKLKNIGFLTGHGEHSVQKALMPSQENGDYTILNELLQKNYLTTEIDLNSENKFNEIDTLIIAGPKQNLNQEELKLITQFINEGGNVIFLIDQVEVNNNLQANETNLEINEFLKNYGIKINKDLIMESYPYNEVAIFNQSITNYAYWPKLSAENFDKSNPIMAELESVVIPWTSSLESLNPDNTQIQLLAQTSPLSYSVTETFNLDPNFNPPVTKNDLKQYPMIALVKNELNPESSQDIQSTESGQILIIGDSDFISDPILNRFPQNLDFILNSIDYLTLDPTLISIRSKGNTDRPLGEISNSTQTLVKTAGIILMPTLVAIYGIIRNIRRKKLKTGINL